MKNTFWEKRNLIPFLGFAICVATILLLKSCNKKNEKDDMKPEKIPIPKALNENKAADKRIIYITVDDGPNKGTENLIKIVHRRKIPITSFVIGKHVFGSKKQQEIFDILKNDTLFEISNHSFSHANNRYAAFYKNPKMVLTDFDLTKDTLKLQNNYARTPGRNIWRISTVNATDLKDSKIAGDVLGNSGYKLVGWDLEWKPDAKMRLKGNHQQMLKRVDSIFFNDLEKTSRHLVFLTHDQYFMDENSVLEFDKFIQKLQSSKRFEFRKISEYPKIDEILN